MARYCEDDYENAVCVIKTEISKTGLCGIGRFMWRGAGQLCGFYRELYGSPLSRHWPEKESWTKNG